MHAMARPFLLKRAAPRSCAQGVLPYVLSDALASDAPHASPTLARYCVERAAAPSDASL